MITSRLTRHTGLNKMKQYIDKASNLIEALPYIRRFYGKIFVIKYGGAAMTDMQWMQQVMQDIALMYFCGIRPVIVHGGGPEISAMCERLQLPTQFAQGQRVTDEATMEVVQMVLLGKTNRALVTALNQHGVKAIGLSGQDAAFLQTEKLINAAHAESIDLGWVGNIVGVDTAFVTNLISNNYVPIIAPIGVDAQGQAYNVNADLAAGAIAGALSAEKLVILSDVNGLYADAKNPETRLSIIKTETVTTLLQENRISGGMIPKLQACLRALEKNVSCAHILDGKMPHSLLLEIFTNEGIGTMVTA